MNKQSNTRKSPVKSFRAIGYAHRSAKFLLDEIAKNPKEKFLVPSFIFAICAGIESTINDAYIDFFHKRMGAEYKEYAKAFIHLRLREKLIVLIPLVSNFSYRMNEDNNDFKALIGLFDLRNNLIHAKQHWHTATITQKGSYYYLEYDNEDSLDFYASDTPKITLDDLKKYMSLFKKFRQDFRNLGGSIGIAGKFERKDYKPRAWFKKIEK
jgi:hypothetical protein